MESATRTDRTVGLGLLFSVLSVGAALAATGFGYAAAFAHGGEAGRLMQLGAGWTIGLAMLAAALAIVAVHWYA